jgi:hypothetical protein
LSHELCLSTQIGFALSLLKFVMPSFGMGGAPRGDYQTRDLLLEDESYLVRSFGSLRAVAQARSGGARCGQHERTSLRQS